MTVPGERTFFPSEYFWVMERESFPVGMFIPSFIAKSLISLTALYNLVFSPTLLAGHIQLALNEIFVIPFSIGAHIIFVKDFKRAIFAPFFSSIKETIGENPIEVAIPLLDLKSSAITPKLFNGNCISPTVCCIATLPVTHLSTLFVNQSLQATDSNERTFSKYFINNF